MNYATAFAIIGIVVVLVLTLVGVVLYKYIDLRSVAKEAREDLKVTLRDLALQAKEADTLDAELEAEKARTEKLVAAVDELNAQIRGLEEKNATLEQMANATRPPFDPAKATDLQILAQIVAAESGPLAPYGEARAIAQVVLNRMAASDKTILQVLEAPGQFSPVTSEAWLWAKPDILETAAAFNAWTGHDAAPIPADVLFFCSRKSSTASEFFAGKRDDLYTVIGDTFFYAK